MTTPESMLVDAQPTKDFFISMLTRDIDLKDALVDLVDNSVDGARKTRPGQDFTGLWVRLTLEEDRFEIADNCGGMSIETAQKYAFRFGRDSRTPRTTRSIGQFGVGMKRTLFKLGTHFTVESRTTSESFTLDVPVGTWRRAPTWDFEFDEANVDESREAGDTGTTIEVTALFDDISETITDDEWLSELEDDLRFKHGVAIRNGLEISVNGEPVAVEPLVLLEGPNLKPGSWKWTFEAEEAAPDTEDDDEDADEDEVEVEPLNGDVEVRLLAGVGNRSSKYAGWYVFCNGRLVVGPDKTRSTAWGVSSPTRIPIYHEQFSRFRGYAFFESDDPARLPWTTTKTGVDVDNGIWKSTRNQMITMTRPVIDFLNLLDRQNTAAGGSDVAAAGLVVPPAQGSTEVTAETVEYAEKLVRDAVSLEVDSHVVETQDFDAPEIDETQFPATTTRISYSRPVHEVDMVKKHMGPNAAGARRSNSEVGEATYEYYLRNEVTG